MQIKSFVPSLVLLLPALASAQRLLLSSPQGFTKRDGSVLQMEPIYKALKPMDPAVAARDVLSALQRRQGCPTGTFQCSNLDICCYTDTVCGVYGGEKGCCPKGKTCSGVSACPLDTVDCLTYCCAKGNTCGRDASGKGVCNVGTGGGEGQCTQAGYVPCSEFEGCCPSGAKCVPPNKCNIPCSASDPPCGTGCCAKGQRCTANLTCVADSGSTTGLGGTTTTRTTAIPTLRPTTTTRITTTTGTSRGGANTIDVEDPETTSSPTSSRRPSTTSSSTTSSSSAAAGNSHTANLDTGIVGMLLGVLGYLAF